MSLNLNKVILGGRLSTAPELKYTPQGTAVTSFSIAVNRRLEKDKADFINCVAWRKTAEFICNYFKKGSSICIVGNIQTRSWDDKNGKRYATEVIADEAYFADSATKAENEDRITPIASKVENTAKFEELQTDDDLPF